jgi:hypothetical protein
MQLVQAGSASGLENFTGTSTGSQLIQTGTVSALETFSGSSAPSQLIQAESGAGNILAAITGTSAGAQLIQTGTASGAETFSGASIGSQIIQTGAGTGNETFSGAAAGAQLVQLGSGTGAATFDGPFTGTSAGTQALQVEAAVATGGTESSAGGGFIQWGQSLVPMAISGASEGQQCPQTGIGEAFNQQAVSGTSSTIQKLNTQQSHGFQEDEAEILAIILAHAA